MLYFFLSYARSEDDVYVKRFYDDLCREVRALTGKREDEVVGFLDNQSIEPGQLWPHALVSALAECASFIPLYSPAFFLSHPCGQEWTMFTKRSAGVSHNEQNSVTGVIPLIWLPPRALPECARTIQYDLGMQDADYRTRGLRQLLRLQRLKDTYLEFVTTVAYRVVEVSGHPPSKGSAQDDCKVFDHRLACLGYLVAFHAVSG